MEALLSLTPFSFTGFHEIVTKSSGDVVKYYVVNDATDNYILKDIIGRDANGKIIIVDPDFLSTKGNRVILNVDNLRKHVLSIAPDINKKRLDAMIVKGSTMIECDNEYYAEMYSYYILLIHALFGDTKTALVNNVIFLNDVKPDVYGEPQFLLNELYLDKLLDRFDIRIFKNPQVRKRVIFRMAQRYDFHIQEELVIDKTKILSLPKILPVD